MNCSLCVIFSVIFGSQFRGRGPGSRGVSGMQAGTPFDGTFAGQRNAGLRQFDFRRGASPFAENLQQRQPSQRFIPARQGGFLQQNRQTFRNTNRGFQQTSFRPRDVTLREAHQPFHSSTRISRLPERQEGWNQQLFGFRGRINPEAIRQGFVNRFTGQSQAVGHRHVQVQRQVPVVNTIHANTRHSTALNMERIRIPTQRRTHIGNVAVVKTQAAVSQGQVAQTNTAAQLQSSKDQRIFVRPLQRQAISVTKHTGSRSQVRTSKHIPVIQQAPTPVKVQTAKSHHNHNLLPQSTVVASSPQAAQSTVVTSVSSAAEVPVVVSDTNVAPAVVVSGLEAAAATGPVAAQTPAVVIGPVAAKIPAARPIAAQIPAVAAGSVAAQASAAAVGSIIAQTAKAASGPVAAQKPIVATGPVLAQTPIAATGPVVAQTPVAVTGPVAAPTPVVASGPVVAQKPIAASVPIVTLTTVNQEPTLEEDIQLIQAVVALLQAAGTAIPIPGISIPKPAAPVTQPAIQPALNFGVNQFGNPFYPGILGPWGAPLSPAILQELMFGDTTDPPDIIATTTVAPNVTAVSASEPAFNVTVVTAAAQAPAREQILAPQGEGTTLTPEVAEVPIKAEQTSAAKELAASKQQPPAESKSSETLAVNSAVKAEIAIDASAGNIAPTLTVEPLPDTPPKPVERVADAIKGETNLKVVSKDVASPNVEGIDLITIITDALKAASYPAALLEKLLKKLSNVIPTKNIKAESKPVAESNTVEVKVSKESVINTESNNVVHTTMRPLVAVDKVATEIPTEVDVVTQIPIDTNIMTDRLPTAADLGVVIKDIPIIEATKSPKVVEIKEKPVEEIIKNKVLALVKNFSANKASTLPNVVEIKQRPVMPGTKDTVIDGSRLVIDPIKSQNTVKITEHPENLMTDDKVSVNDYLSNKNNVDVNSAPDVTLDKVSATVAVTNSAKTNESWQVVVPSKKATEFDVKPHTTKDTKVIIKNVDIMENNVAGISQIKDVPSDSTIEAALDLTPRAHMGTKKIGNDAPMIGGKVPGVTQNRDIPIVIKHSVVPIAVDANGNSVEPAYNIESSSKKDTPFIVKNSAINTELPQGVVPSKKATEATFDVTPHTAKGTKVIAKNADIMENNVVGVPQIKDVPSDNTIETALDLTHQADKGTMTIGNDAPIIGGNVYVPGVTQNRDIPIVIKHSVVPISVHAKGNSDEPANNIESSSMIDTPLVVKNSAINTELSQVVVPSDKTTEAIIDVMQNSAHNSEVITKNVDIIENNVPSVSHNKDVPTDNTIQAISDVTPHSGMGTMTIGNNAPIIVNRATGVAQNKDIPIVIKHSVVPIAVDAKDNSVEPAYNIDSSSMKDTPLIVTNSVINTELSQVAVPSVKATEAIIDVIPQFAKDMKIRPKNVGIIENSVPSVNHNKDVPSDNTIKAIFDMSTHADMGTKIIANNLIEPAYNIESSHTVDAVKGVHGVIQQMPLVSEKQTTVIANQIVEDIPVGTITELRPKESVRHKESLNNGITASQIVEDIPVRTITELKPNESVTQKESFNNGITAAAEAIANTAGKPALEIVLESLAAQSGVNFLSRAVPAVDPAVVNKLTAVPKLSDVNAPEVKRQPVISKTLIDARRNKLAVGMHIKAEVTNGQIVDNEIPNILPKSVPEETVVNVNVEAEVTNIVADSPKTDMNITKNKNDTNRNDSPSVDVNVHKSPHISKDSVLKQIDLASLAKELKLISNGTDITSYLSDPLFVSVLEDIVNQTLSGASNMNGNVSSNREVTSTEIPIMTSTEIPIVTSTEVAFMTTTEEPPEIELEDMTTIAAPTTTTAPSTTTAPKPTKKSKRKRRLRRKWRRKPMKG